MISAKPDLSCDLSNARIPHVASYLEEVFTHQQRALSSQMLHHTLALYRQKKMKQKSYDRSNKKDISSTFLCRGLLSRFVMRIQLKNRKSRNILIKYSLKK